METYKVYFNANDGWNETSVIAKSAKIAKEIIMNLYYVTEKEVYVNA